MSSPEASHRQPDYFTDEVIAEYFAHEPWTEELSTKLPHQIENFIARVGLVAKFFFNDENSSLAVMNTGRPHTRIVANVADGDVLRITDWVWLPQEKTAVRNTSVAHKKTSEELEAERLEFETLLAAQDNEIDENMIYPNSLWKITDTTGPVNAWDVEKTKMVCSYGKKYDQLLIAALKLRKQSLALNSRLMSTFCRVLDFDTLPVDKINTKKVEN